MNAGKIAGLTGAMLAVLVSMSACASPSSSASASAVDSVPTSSSCGVTVTWDWDGSPGAATRSESLSDIAAYLKQRERDVESAGARSGEGDGLDDPLDVRIAIRNLEELSRALESVEMSARDGEDLLVESDVTQGGVVASALIIAVPAGGYRLDTLVAPGSTSDDPSCAD